MKSMFVQRLNLMKFMFCLFSLSVSGTSDLVRLMMIFFSSSKLTALNVDINFDILVTINDRLGFVVESSVIIGFSDE